MVCVTVASLLATAPRAMPISTAVKLAAEVPLSTAETSSVTDRKVRLVVSGIATAASCVKLRAVAEATDAVESAKAYSIVLVLTAICSYSIKS